MKSSEIISWFINLSGVFGHYSFFTNELWRKVDGFKKEDKAEIIAAFLHYWVHNKFGCFTCPIGSGWCCEVSEETYNSYIKRFEPIINEFENWIQGQR